MGKTIKKLSFITFTSSILLLNGCVFQADQVKLSGASLKEARNARDNSSKEDPIVVEITTVILEDDQLKVSGSNLDSVTSAKLDAHNLSIISQSANEIILSTSSIINLALNTAMDLIFTNAYGQAVTPVQFNLVDGAVTAAKLADDSVTTSKIADGAVTAAKLDSMGASVGQLIKWNGTTWIPADLGALTYAGQWDASVGGVSNPNVAAVGGEYYIVSSGGTTDPGDGNTRTWNQGDWIVYNDNTSSWDQISNTSDVSSFNTRTGAILPQANDYTWAQIDKTTSSVGDIADIDLSTAPTTGQVLKFDGTNWVASDDAIGGAAGSVTSSTISDNSIVDADINSAAAISWSKINKSGAAPSDVGLGNLDNIQQMPLNYLDTTATLGTDDAKVPSQAAVKSYVDGAVTGMGSVTSITGGAGLTDGPITTSGILDVNVDNSSIEIVSDALQVKALGVGTGHLAAGAVTTAKIAAGAVTDSEITDVAHTKITTACADGEVLSASSGAFVCLNTSSTGNWTLSGSDIYYAAGKVGVGVIAPTSALDVQGVPATALTGTLTVSAGTATVTGTGTLFTTELSVGQSIIIGSEAYNVLTITDNTNLTLSSNHIAGASGATAYSDSSLLNIKAGSGTSRLYISESGNVGIGSTSPGNKLTISGGNIMLDNNTALGFKTSSGAERSMIIMQSDDNLRIGNTGTGDGNDTVSFNITGKANVMNIDSSGNVGIGTTTPASLLDVNGTITATGFSGPLTSSGVSADAGTAAAPSYRFSADTDTGFYSDTANTIGITVNGTNIFDMSSAGITSATAGGGVMTTASGSNTAPTFSFKGDEDTGWYAPAANNLAAATGGVERIRIDGSGNIGVGTSSPSSLVEISASNAALTVNGRDSSLTARTGILKLAGARQTNGRSFGEVNFINFDNSGAAADHNLVSIRAEREDANGAQLSFYTSNSGALVGDETDIPSLQINNVGRTIITNSDDDDIARIALTARRMKSGSSAPAAGFGALINFSLEGFSNGAVTPAGTLGAIWENTQSNDTTDRDSSLIFETTSDDTLVERMRITSSGNVGIGVNIPSEKLQVNGNVLATAYLYTSDLRFKKNVQRIPASLDTVSELEGVTFDWRNDEFPERSFPEERTMGFIAQDVERVIPELVHTTKDGYKSVQYGNITALLVEAIKEVKDKLTQLFSNDDKLERKISSLEKENQQLRAEMEEIKKNLAKLSNQKTKE